MEESVVIRRKIVISFTKHRMKSFFLYVINIFQIKETLLEILSLFYKFLLQIMLSRYLLHITYYERNFYLYSYFMCQHRRSLMNYCSIKSTTYYYNIIISTILNNVRSFIYAKENIILLIPI